MNINPQHTPSKRGFTLLELLIVIAIIAILSVVVVLVLNPAETLKKTRDASRISDLNTLKTALGLYLTTITSPELDGLTGTNNCVDGASDKLYVSFPSDAPGAAITDISPPTNFTFRQETNAELYTIATVTQTVDATQAGWIPVAMGGITGGSPLSNWPVDPTNTIPTANLGAVTNSELIYRYACDASDQTFEIAARLESTAYTFTENKHASDGGNNANLYEVGTKLTILPSTNDF